MPEWLNGTVLKTVEPSRVPGVRIPLSPPHHKSMIIHIPIVLKLKSKTLFDFNNVFLYT